MTIPAAAALPLDLRRIPPPERHPRIFSIFRSLLPGQALELVNDHDPAPLHRQFQAELPGRFEWQVLEAGPATWRVSVTRLADPQARGRCCGACGGA